MNFLGPGHLERFDPEKLERLGSDVVRDGRDAAWVMAPEPLWACEEPDVQARLLALTHEFRNAKHPA